MPELGQSPEEELNTTKEAYPFQKKLIKIFSTAKPGLPPEKKTGSITRRLAGIPRTK